MKKRFLFDLVALLAIAVGFLMILYFQDLDVGFLLGSEYAENENQADKTFVENEKYGLFKEPEEDKSVELSKQVFEQPSEEELKNCYYYSVLNEDEKRLYCEIYSVLSSMGKDMPLSSMDVDLVEKIFKCVLNDHPSLYYVEGYTYTTFTRGGELSKLEFSGTYAKSMAECELINFQIENYVVECFRGMKSTSTDYEKVKYIYDYIIKNTEYNLAAEDSQNICSVFLNGESVCMGYARAMQYLLLEQNILCTIVNGTAQQGEEHAWNLLLLDGQYYHLDVTWGDDSYTVANNSSVQVGMTNYSFFCVTTEEISKTHVIDSVVAMPECIAYENNYYVKEGYYFKSFDADRLYGIFEKAYADNKEYVEIKCADSVVYREMYTYLIENQHIFDYLKDEKDTVSYYDGEELLLLEFWLK